MSDESLLGDDISKTAFSEALSQRYVRKAQSAAGNENLDLTAVPAGESIKHLQSATAELAHEIESALDRRHCNFLPCS